MNGQESPPRKRELPLLEAFLELRRLDFELGVPEYVALLEALDAGIALGGPGSWREEVTFLCQALWAKTIQQREQVRRVVTLALPEVPTASEIRLAIDGPDPPDARVPESTGSQPPAGSVGTSPPPGPVEDGGDEVAIGEDGPMKAVSSHVRAGALALPDARPTSLRVTVGTRFDLTGSLPVTYRQMHRAWRQYRRMARTGPPVELDAAATLARFARHGVLDAPVFVPRRRNRARALVLVDVHGSMVPFRHLTRALIRAAEHAGLARVDVRYFHDAPGGAVFLDDRLQDAQPLGDASAPFVDSGIMILSDAGAARRGHDPERVAVTATAIEQLRRVTPAIAWLNPVPAGRWPGTTAAAIRDRTEVAMFGFDRRGVQSVVDTMRGQVR